jgi:hypothetical protein
VLTDFKGTKLEVGQIVRCKEGYYRRIDFVGEKNIIPSFHKDTIEEARKTETSDYGWNQKEINEYELTVVEQPLLELRDKNGDEVHKYDWIVSSRGDTYQVFGCMSSFNNDNKCFFILKDDFSTGGWGVGFAEKFTLIKKENKETIKFTAPDGTVLNISKQTLRELKKLEIE